MRNEKCRQSDRLQADVGYAFTLKTPYYDKTSPRGNVGLSLSGRFECVAPAVRLRNKQESCGYRRSQ